MPIEVIEHHRQLHGRPRSVDGLSATNLSASTTDPADGRPKRGPAGRLRSNAQIGIAGQGPRQRLPVSVADNFRLGRSAKRFAEQFAGHGKAQQLEVPEVHDFKRLGGIDDRDIAGAAICSWPRCTERDRPPSCRLRK